MAAANTPARVQIPDRHGFTGLALRLRRYGAAGEAKATRSASAVPAAFPKTVAPPRLENCGGARKKSLPSPRVCVAADPIILRLGRRCSAELAGCERQTAISLDHPATRDRVCRWPALRRSGLVSSSRRGGLPGSPWAGGCSLDIDLPFSGAAQSKSSAL